MNSVIRTLNDLLSFWKDDHDVLSRISSVFTEEDGFICFAGLALCKLTEDLDVFCSDHDAHSIVFSLSNDRYINIQFAWPEDAGPVISSVSFMYQLYNEDELYIETASGVVS